jgi:hypothetical protein
MAGVVVVTRRRRWVAAWGHLAIAVACLCAAPGPLGQVDGGMGGALGAVRSPSPSSWRVVVAFGGSLPGRSTTSASRASARRGAFPGRRASARGGRRPLPSGSRRHTFTPLRRHWVVWRRLRSAAVARVRGELGPLGPLAMWWGVLPVPSVALGVAALRRAVSWVVACTGREDCVARCLGCGCADETVVGVVCAAWH